MYSHWKVVDFFLHLVPSILQHNMTVEWKRKLDVNRCRNIMKAQVSCICLQWNEIGRKSKCWKKHTDHALNHAKEFLHLLIPVTLKYKFRPCISNGSYSRLGCFSGPPHTVVIGSYCKACTWLWLRVILRPKALKTSLKSLITEPKFLSDMSWFQFQLEIVFVMTVIVPLVFILATPCESLQLLPGRFGWLHIGESHSAVSVLCLLVLLVAVYTFDVSPWSWKEGHLLTGLCDLEKSKPPLTNPNLV